MSIKEIYYLNFDYVWSYKCFSGIEQRCIKKIPILVERRMLMLTGIKSLENSIILPQFILMVDINKMVCS